MNLTTLPYPLDGESFMKYSLIHQYDGNTAIIGIKPHPSGRGLPLASPGGTMYGFKHVLWYDLLEEKFFLFQDHKKTIEAFANHNVVISPISGDTLARIPKTMIGPCVYVDENTKVFCKLAAENA